MKCIILAAGYATRLYPLTENFPKPLLKVGEKSIIDWLVDDITEQVEEFIVVTNHRFYGHFLEWARGRQKIRILDDGSSSNETRLGAVKDIQFAVEKTGIRDDCLVMAGDNVLDFSLRHFVRFAQEKKTSCVMAHREECLAALQKTAVITIQSDGRITSYEEKPENPKGTLAVPPFYYYTGSDIHRIEEALSAGCGYDAPGSFAAWLSSQTPMHAYIMPGRRYDIGDRKSYDMVQSTFRGVKEYIV